MICLLAFLMIVLPLNRTASLDVKRGAVKHSETVPTWALWLLRFQIAVPYVGGGIAKLNADWLRGEPLRTWLAARTGDPLLGKLYTLEPVVYLMSYGGLVLDLVCPFLLFFPKTRRWAFLALLMFHTLNSRVFSIGVFPWLMIAATVVFFPPEWPRRLWRDVREENGRAITALLVGSAFGFTLSTQFPSTESGVQALLGAVGWAVFAYDLARPIPDQETAPGRRTLAAPAAVLLAVWIAVQVIVPLRHLWIPGNVHWTEEGHNFSWHMKLRDKRSRTAFWVQPPGGEKFRIRQQDWLSSRQILKMSTRPHMMVKFAHHLASTYERHEGVRPRITADVVSSLNSRRLQQMIDPEQDLAAVPLNYEKPAPWIVPLTTPLQEKRDLGPGG